MLPARYSPVTHAGSVCACPVTVLPKSGVNNQERRLYLPSAILQHISFSVMLLWCQAPARHSLSLTWAPASFSPKPSPRRASSTWVLQLFRVATVPFNSSRQPGTAESLAWALLPYSFTDAVQLLQHSRGICLLLPALVQEFAIVLVLHKDSGRLPSLGSAHMLQVSRLQGF